MMRWSILPAYLVRLAGFAFDRLEALRCPEAATAAEALDEAEAERRAAGRAPDETLGQERYAEHPAVDDPAARQAPTRHFKQARAFARLQSDVPPPAEALGEVVRIVSRVAALVAALVEAHARWQGARRAFGGAFADELERTRAAIRRLYQDERLQE